MNNRSPNHWLPLNQFIGTMYEDLTYDEDPHLHCL